MDYNEWIMSILEENGLDKRFRDNPEAVRQICSLVISDIEKKSNTSIENSGGKEAIEEAVRNVVKGYDFPVESDHSYLINEDGSLSVKHKTNVTRNSADETRVDTEQTFSIGEKRGDFVVTESSDYVSQTQDSTFASTGVNIHIFNSKGLEIQSKALSQDVNVDTAIGIRSSKDAFYANTRSGVNYKLSPVTEEIIERRPDLATEIYHMQKSNNSGILVYRKGGIIEEHIGKDAIGSPIPISGHDTVETKRGVVPVLPLQYCPNYLVGYHEENAEAYAKESDEEKGATRQAVYEESAARSQAFRETLFDSAATNPELQQVVERLGLVRTKDANEESLMRTWGVVKVADLEKIYKGITDKELRATTARIINTSKAANRAEQPDKIEEK